MMKLGLLIILTVISISSCSSRVEYPRVAEPHAANAIDVNTAAVEDLEKLPHIGRKTAEAIVRYREDNGPFRRVEHLLLIRGVSEARFAEMRPLVMVADE